MLVTSKGQVTIPQQFRNMLGLLPHTEVEFDVVDGELRVRRTGHACSRGKKLVQHLAGKGSVQMTTEEIMRLTRHD